MLFALLLVMRALIVDGQNNHDWRNTTPVLKKTLEATGLFEVDVNSTPQAGIDFTPYRLVVSNYNGDLWPAAVRSAFEAYVEGGGGFICYHAADNAFPEWTAYNRMIGVGGWGGRNEKSGPIVRVVDGKTVLDGKTAGPAGHHGPRHAFQINTRDLHHPIVSDLPRFWLHASDELYDTLRGPAEQLRVLASAHSDKALEGTGFDEPVLMAITYGKGRVFHTTLGHDVEAMRCVGFVVTFQRGAEWAATGKVKQKVPVNFPGTERVVVPK